MTLKVTTLFIKLKTRRTAKRVAQGSAIDDALGKSFKLLIYISQLINQNLKFRVVTPSIPKLFQEQTNH